MNMGKLTRLAMLILMIASAIWSGYAWGQSEKQMKVEKEHPVEITPDEITFSCVMRIDGRWRSARVAIPRSSWNELHTTSEREE